ncbi:hypothetical protein SDC9_186160 [bioreactor metagenome]|uniref:Uncharacterized protein n=1 Tax=bioreactor metagenome TaxID=1076179 RepID=A0A645HJ56_9ZZZZ
MYGNPAIDYIHIVIRHYVSYCASAALIHLAQLSGLPGDAVLVHDPSYLCDEFRVCVIAAAFSSRTRILIEGDPLA